MKKICLALFFLPAISFANSVNFASASYTWWSNSPDYVNIESLGINYKSVINEQFTLEAAYSDVTLETYYGSVSDHTVTAGLDYAFGSFSSGSIYVGADWQLTDEQNHAVTIGYSKRNGEGFDYDLSTSRIDGDSNVISGSFRYPLGDSGLGLTLGLARTEGQTLTSTGVTLVF